MCFLLFRSYASVRPDWKAEALCSHFVYSSVPPFLCLFYKSVIIAKLSYTASAWWGFTTATNRQRLEALIKRGVRSGLCGVDVSTLTEMVGLADDALFQFYIIPTTFYICFYPISVRQDTISDIDATTEFYLQRLEPFRLITF